MVGRQRGLKLMPFLSSRSSMTLIDQARSLMVQGDAAQVNVVVGFLAGGGDHVPAHNSQLHNHGAGVHGLLHWGGFQKA